ncbi:hypothetical protein D3C86_1026770 [compost metagenome]
MDGENEAASAEPVVMLWPREEDYARFVEVSTDRPPATYAEFVARAQPYLDALRAQGLDVSVLHPDPDRMAAWCKANFGQVNTNARAAYAGVVALEEDPDQSSIN